MQCSTANTQQSKQQARFALRAKTVMLQRNLTVTDIAKDLGQARNTVSLALNRGLFKPTRLRIAKYLGIHDA